MCRTTYKEESREDDVSSCTSTSDGSSSEDESCFPLDEVHALERRHQALSRALPVVDRIPTTCGIVQNLQLVGVFPSARWLTDPTMPPDVKELFGGTPFFALGEYRVAHLDLQDGSGRKQPCTIVVNAGVPGLLTGYWGGAFGRHPPHICWARFETTGELETTVKERRRKPKRKLQKQEEDWLFQEIDSIEFCEANFQGGSLPGICNSQLERLLGTTVEFLFSLDWNAVLPESLVEIRDSTPRAERKLQRARQPATPRKLVDEQAFAF
jgi:hypothetical protein